MTLAHVQLLCSASLPAAKHHHTTMLKLKRKASCELGSVTDDRINPLSHSPGTIRQLTLAGLGINSHLPTDRGFPHKRFNEGDVDGLQHRNDFDDDDDEETPQPTLRTSKKPRVQGATPFSSSRMHGSNTKTECIRNLSQILPVLMDAGQFEKARRVFAILVRFRGANGILGIDKDGLWATALELLAHQDKHDGRHRTRSRVDQLLDDLIRRNPWARSRPVTFTSALQYWYVLYSYQVHGVYTSFVASSTAEDEEEEELGGENTGHAGSKSADAAVTKLQDIGARMDRLLQDQPYATDKPLAELRSVVSAMLADLAERGDQSD